MSDRTCIEDGCNRPLIARGRCVRCYQRWRTANRDAKIGFQQRGADPAERFRDKIVVQADGCHMWTACTNKYGYGVFQIKPRLSIQAHIYAWMLAHDGERPPKGTQLDHMCHDPDVCTLGNDCPHRRCVRLDHLAVATPQENTLRSNAASTLNRAKTHCPRGHEYNDVNTCYSGGRRKCRVCARERAYAKAHGVTVDELLAE